MDDEQREPTRREWTGFWSMIAQQTQNAFNDKAAQFVLVPLGGAVAFGVFGARVEDFAALLIPLAYILFAPLAGWMSDRFSKRSVLIGSAVAQLVFLGALCAAVHAQEMPFALVVFFALAVQSAFFSPAKIGINKELVGSRHLGFATGIQQMTCMIAMLTGQIVAGVVFDRQWTALGGTRETAWQAAFFPLVILTVLSIPAILLAWMVSRTPAQGGEKLRPAVFVQHFHHLRDLWSDAPLRRASFGAAYFWGFAAFINLWSVKLAAEITGGGSGFGTLSSTYMAAASLGMIGGFAATAFLLRRRIELGWVPVGGVAMTVLSLLLALPDPAGPLFLTILAALAFSSALFLAPLNAWMQDRYPAEKRGKLQAATNLQDCFAGILAISFLYIIGKAGQLAGLDALTGLRGQLVAAAVANGLITWFIIKLLPSDFIRVIGLMLLRLIYRIRSSGERNLPEKGGALLLPNHITWADAFFLTAASPRPVRFIMEEGFMGTAAIRVFCQLFDTVPISSAKPREALRAASDSLRQGHVVCIFPEGQLTRTGTLRELKRGFELIARQAGCPLVPACIDGAWGSIFSFEGNRFFRKVPQRLRYGISVAFGPPIAPAEANLERIRHGMMSASAQALDARVGHDDPARANAFQIAHVNALQRGADFGVLEEDPLRASLPGLLAFEKLFRAIPRKSRHPNPSTELHWLGGNPLRQRIEESPAGQPGGVFFDFSDRAATPLHHAGWLHCPCLAIDGIVVAMSMPDQSLPQPDSKPQAGRKPGSLGILLPGFSIEDSTLRGPTAPGGIKLPDGYHLDEEGFLFPSASNSEPH